LKFRAVFFHTPAHILSLAAEIDLAPTWNRFAVATRKLASPRPAEQFMYGVQWMMKPFRHLQVLLRCRGFDLAEEHRSLLVLLGDAGVEELPPGGAAALPPEAKAKWATANFLPGSCIRLRPLPPGPDGGPQTEAFLQVHLDPHIPYTPATLVNFVLGVLGPYIFAQVRAVLDEAFGDEGAGGLKHEGKKGAAAGESPFRARVAAQPELYGRVDARCAEFAGRLGGEWQ
jgi:hypothetical protein